MKTFWNLKKIFSRSISGIGLCTKTFFVTNFKESFNLLLLLTPCEIIWTEKPQTKYKHFSCLSIFYQNFQLIFKILLKERRLNFFTLTFLTNFNEFQKKVFSEPIIDYKNCDKTYLRTRVIVVYYLVELHFKRVCIFTTFKPSFWFVVWRKSSIF